jgi:hypothetical protein
VIIEDIVADIENEDVKFTRRGIFGLGSAAIASAAAAFPQTRQPERIRILSSLRKPITAA